MVYPRIGLTFIVLFIISLCFAAEDILNSELQSEKKPSTLDKTLNTITDVPINVFHWPFSVLLLIEGYRTFSIMLNSFKLTLGNFEFLTSENSLYYFRILKVTKVNLYE